MKLITILENTVSPDQNELEVAQRFLEHAAIESLPSFLVELSKVLANRRNTQVARMAAGLQVKNYLTSKDPDIKKQYQQRWLTIDAKVRCKVKAFVLQALGTETHRPSSASQCVAGIACAEITVSQGPELIPQLVTNLTDPSNTERMKVSTLEAIGYICQDIDPEHLKDNSNQILTAIIQGMRKEEPSNSIKLAATNALINSLEFTKANLDKKTERHLIMQVVCEATQCTDIRVQVTALQTLAKIMSVYYEYMETYMDEDLFPITTEAMKSDIDEVALQGIEFWSTVCDKEIELAVQVYEASEQGHLPKHTSQFYAQGALQDLVPILIQTLTKQDENDDDDYWNPCHAAGVCLMLLATCCEDDVISHVQLFVKKYIKHPDWRYRDACVMAFGIILEGPEPNLLKPQVIQAMPTLIELMKDPSVVVRDTTAWIAGRICALLPEAAINEIHLLPLLQCLIEGLRDEPCVASKVCWAFFSLAVANKAMDSVDQEKPSTYCLSSSFEIIIQKLLETTDRPDGHQKNLSSEAYDALMMIVMNSPEDCYPAIQKISDKVMDSLLRMFFQNSAGSGGVQEDTLMAISTLSNLCWTLKTNILPYCDEIVHLLLENLGNENIPWSVKPRILSAFGDIALNIRGEFKKYLKIVLDTVQRVSQAQADYDTVDNLNEWREGYLMAYTGIIHGLHPDEMLMQPWMEFILVFTSQIAEDENHSDDILASAVGLIGDLTRVFGKDVRKLVEKCPLINNLLMEGRRSKISSTKKLATWATEEFRKYKNNK